MTILASAGLGVFLATFPPSQLLSESGAARISRLYRKREGEMEAATAAGGDGDEA